MKNIFLLTGIVAASFTMYAQEEMETKNEDTTRIRLKHTEILIIENRGSSASSDTVTFEPVELRKNKAHWAGVDFGFNIITNQQINYDPHLDPYSPNDVASSQVWNLNLLEHKFKIVKEYFGLTTGFGFNFTQVGIRGNKVLEKSDIEGLYIANVDTVINYQKNKLRATYITVPVLLEFNTNKNNNKGFYLATGIVGGYRIGASYKRVYEVDGDKRKSKQKGGYNLNPFKLDLTARLGYGDFGAFVTYGLTPLLENGSNSLHSLSAGITLNF